MSQLIQKAFDKEVETIRANPKLCGDWGYLQEYLHDCLVICGSQNFNVVEIEGHHVPVLYKMKDGKVMVTIHADREECTKGPGEKRSPEDLYTAELFLPDDLQEIILAERK